MASDLNFLHCGSFPRCTAAIDKRFDGYFTLQFSTLGAVELSYDRKPMMLKGRWFWTAYPGPLVAFHPANGHRFWSHRYVAFTGSRVHAWRDAGLYPFGPMKAPRDPTYEARFDALLKCVRRGDSISGFRAINLLESILIDLAEERSSAANVIRSNDERWLADAIASLSTSAASAVGGKIDYPAMATRAAMGLSTFRRRFKNSTGVSPHTFALRVRTAKARELLGDSDLPIKAIADRLGFSDVYFFTRQFKKFAGVTPGEFRRSRQH